jgi:hypothetical protein
MFANPEAAPWALDTVWGRSSEGIEPPLPVCWLPPPLIAVGGLPFMICESAPGTDLEVPIEIPDSSGDSDPWTDPIIGMEPTPEPELPEEPAPWDDPIHGEYQMFLEENPQWLEENGGGGMQIQVMTPSQYLPWIELGTPGQAMAFDRWYHQTYLAPELPETAGEPGGAPMHPGTGEFEGDVVFDLCITSMQLRNLPVFSTTSEPSLLAPSPIASLQTEPSPSTQEGLETVAIAADRPASLQTTNPFPSGFPDSPIPSRGVSRGVAVPALTDQVANTGAALDLEASIPAPIPLPASEGVSPLEADLPLTPLGLDWLDLSLWRPARLETRSQA